MSDPWALGTRGDATALIDASTGELISYRALKVRVDALARELAGERTLAFVACRQDVASIVAYLAALAAGHAVFLFDAELKLRAELEQSYRPGFIIEGDAISKRSQAHTLHPSLQLLLSTSGTTGSPKLVRLSWANLQANARSIAQYLELDASERAITSLPFHYSYGLSVLNSHLAVGASLVVSDASVMRPELWSAIRTHEVTSFAGVPYAYQIMRRVGFDKMELPSLRTLTQAGGKLPTPLVAHYHTLMKARGGRFFAMYGQTEATARISYLPADRGDKAGSIGIAIPDGTLALEDEELVYRGPNVMLGYATSAEQLALGDTQQGVLRTGDLGTRDEEGFFYITGRLKRFAKVYGLRINLDELEAKVRVHGNAAVLSDDERLTIYTEFGTDEELAAL
ncbi:MAG TPA: AMP-binding protein, partial [Polyangiales bacterium]|nr:AMP-binding protein [Polyangiales bacterium]